MLTQAIAGLGGVGKTTLATDYAYEFATGYDVVWEIPCEDTASARLALAELAVKLGLAPDTNDPNTWEAAREWLEHHGGWLLLCDNAVGYDQLNPLLPKGGGGHILITSRNANWRKLGGEPLTLPPLGPAEGAQFLLRRTGRAASEETDARGLSLDLGGLPWPSSSPAPTLRSAPSHSPSTARFWRPRPCTGWSRWRRTWRCRSTSFRRRR